MITLATLTFIISNFCGLKDPKISEAAKLDCMDFMINCSIRDASGQTTNKVVDQCRENYLKGARYRE
jgi:hypothetical protein